MAKTGKFCVICGKYFFTNSPKVTKSCGSQDCRDEMRRLRWARYAAKRRRKLSYNKFCEPNTLIEDAAEAKAANMSYGQYKAAQYCKSKEKEWKRLEIRYNSDSISGIF